MPAFLYKQQLSQLLNASELFANFIQTLNETSLVAKALEETETLDVLDDFSGSFKVDHRLALLVFRDVLWCYRRLGHTPGESIDREDRALLMLYGMISCKNINVEALLNFGGNIKWNPLLASFVELVDGNLQFSPEPNFLILPYFLEDTEGLKDDVAKYVVQIYSYMSSIAKVDGAITGRESSFLASLIKGYEDAAAAGFVSRDAEQGASSSKAMRQLNELIGLVPVKSEITKLRDFVKIQKSRQIRGMKVIPVSYHCVFTGNPGTGKTTVARIVSEIYKELGVLKKGHLVETDRSGLVAEYVGQTAAKTNAVIDSALDGVLFIDEAYALVGGDKSDYGPEAVATLLKRMEDNRNRLVVILAGYTDEITAFINSNPGLQSRFNRYIEFPDYNAEELTQMFLRNAAKNEYTCSEEVKLAVNERMAGIVAQKDKHFGNGRFARNFFEKVIERQAMRLAGMGRLSQKQLAEITVDDISF